MTDINNEIITDNQPASLSGNVANYQNPKYGGKRPTKKSKKTTKRSKQSKKTIKRKTAKCWWKFF